MTLILCRRVRLNPLTGLGAPYIPPGPLAQRQKNALGQQSNIRLQRFSPQGRSRSREVADVVPPLSGKHHLSRGGTAPPMRSPARTPPPRPRTSPRPSTAAPSGLKALPRPSALQLTWRCEQRGVCGWRPAACALSRRPLYPACCDPGA